MVWRMGRSSSTTSTLCMVRPFQTEDERSAAARRVLHRELAAHGRGEAGGHRQAEADPARTGAVAVAEALEGLEEAFPPLPGNPRSLVDDPDHHVVTGGGRLDPDRDA